MPVTSAMPHARSDVTFARLLPLRLFATLGLAVRNLFRHRRRSLVAILSVAVGIAALVVASGFTEWMFVDFREAMIESQYAHVQVTRPGFHENGASDPFRYVLPPDQPARRRRKASPSAFARAAPDVDGSRQSRRRDGFVHRRGLRPGERADRRSFAADAGGQPAAAGRPERGPSRTRAGDAARRQAGRCRRPAGEQAARRASMPPTPALPGFSHRSARPTTTARCWCDRHAARTLLKVPGPIPGSCTSTTPGTRRSGRRRICARGFDPKAVRGAHLGPTGGVLCALGRSVAGAARRRALHRLRHHSARHRQHHDDERHGAHRRDRHLDGAGGQAPGRCSASSCSKARLIGLVGGLGGLALAFADRRAASTCCSIEMPPPPGLTRGYIARVLLTRAASSLQHR